jgi:hypothetical protein
MKSLIRQGTVPVLAVVYGALRRVSDRRGLPPYKLRARTGALLSVVGGRGWLQLSKQMLQEVVDFAGLTPESNVVEIGCSCGITAISMKNYLTRGYYTGLDIIPECIEWCQAHLADNRFHFFEREFYHELYNPTGTKSLKDINSQIQDKIVDFVFLISVFTHLFWTKPPTT